MTSASDIPSDQPDAAAEMLDKADRFAWSARWLADMQPPGRTAFPPVWQCGLQAIELYLGAFLAGRGLTSFDPGSAVQAASGLGLVLRQRTRGHLRRAVSRQDYLAARFNAPVSDDEQDELALLWATLDDLDRKVRAAIAPETPRLAPEPAFDTSHIAAE